MVLHSNGQHCDICCTVSAFISRPFHRAGIVEIAGLYGCHSAGKINYYTVKKKA